MNETPETPMIPPHHPMRRKERELTREEALAIFARAEVATVSMVTEEGPYAVPVSPVCLNNVLYFHSAFAGRKVEVLKRDPRVWISAFTDVHAAIDKFTTYYESAMAWGNVRFVTEPDEKIAALRALCEKFTPMNMADFDRAVQASLPRTALYALPLDHISGKAKRKKPAPPANIPHA